MVDWNDIDRAASIGLVWSFVFWIPIENIQIETISVAKNRFVANCKFLKIDLKFFFFWNWFTIASSTELIALFDIIYYCNNRMKMRFDSVLVKKFIPSIFKINSFVHSKAGNLIWFSKFYCSLAGVIFVSNTLKTLQHSLRTDFQWKFLVPVKWARKEGSAKRAATLFVTESDRKSIYSILQNGYRTGNGW